MGRFHAEKFARFPASELAAVVDPDPAHAAPISDFRKVLGDVDAAVIAVPTHLHHEVARAFLERGLHVLIEKPLAATLAEADDLVDLASKKNAVLQVGHVAALQQRLQGAREARRPARCTSTPNASPASSSAAPKST